MARHKRTICGSASGEKMTDCSKVIGEGPGRMKMDDEGIFLFASSTRKIVDLETDKANKRKVKKKLPYENIMTITGEQILSQAREYISRPSHLTILSVPTLVKKSRKRRRSRRSKSSI
jgi:hypothetical protein